MGDNARGETPTTDTDGSTPSARFDSFPGKDSTKVSSTQVEHQEQSIEPENEITGLRLLVIHTGTTLATFLAGLVSTEHVWCRSQSQANEQCRIPTSLLLRSLTSRPNSTRFQTWAGMGPLST